MDEVPTDERTDSLGRRVHWLDRNRRRVAIAIAVVMTPGLELAQAVARAATGLAFTRGCSRSRSPCLAGG